jgi:hypothetical protein
MGSALPNAIDRCVCNTKFFREGGLGAPNLGGGSDPLDFLRREKVPAAFEPPNLASLYLPYVGLGHIEPRGGIDRAFAALHGADFVNLFGCQLFPLLWGLPAKPIALIFAGRFPIQVPRVNAGVMAPVAGVGGLMPVAGRWTVTALAHNPVRPDPALSAHCRIAILSARERPDQAKFPVGMVKVIFQPSP